MAYGCALLAGPRREDATQGSYNLWNREGKPDGVGYYKAEKNCDDPENCYLQFWCLNDDGDLYYNC